MNKLLLITGIALAGAASAMAAVPPTVQGHPYKSPRIVASAYGEPGPISGQDFDFSEIKAWAGEGSKQCAFILQWSDDNEDNAIVFGYRWDGEATGIDAAKAVVAMHPRLYGAFTDGGTYGSTIDGFGWDANDDQKFSVTLSGGTIITADDKGLLRGGAAGYDGSSATDPEDYWHGGWFDGYWSYWTYDPGDSEFSYSQVGASGRNLVDGCIDGWIFAPGLQTSPWKEWVAAPAPSSNSFAIGDIFSDNIFEYTVTNVDGAKEVAVSKLQFSYKYTKVDIAVPETTEYKGETFKVTGIGDDVFSYGSNTSITLPSTLRTIGSSAFSGCKNITSLIIPESVTSIGSYAFADMPGITEMDIPESVSEISEYMFNNCTALTSVTGAEGITSIGRASFMGCPSLQNIEGMSKNTSIGRFAFSSCGVLKYLPDMPMLAEISEGAFSGCMKLKYIVLPQTIAHGKLSEIFSVSGSAETVLYSCAATPSEQTGVYTLAYGRDTSRPYLADGLYGDLYVPYGCIDTYQKMSVWNDCTIKQLTPTVNISAMTAQLDENEVIFKAALVATAADDTDIPELFIKANDFSKAAATVANALDFQYRESGGNAIFDGIVTVGENNTCTVTLSNLPAGNYEYRWTNETHAAAGEPVITTEWQTFTVDAPKEAEIGEHFSDDIFEYVVTAVGDNPEVSVFKLLNKNTDSAIIPETTNIYDKDFTVTAISDNAFESTKIRYITLPSTISTIGECAFYGCNNLAELTIPSSVTTLGEWSMYKCTSLTHVYGAENLTKLEPSTFMYCSALKVLEGCSKVTVIGEMAFYGCSELETIPDMPQLTTIDNGAFGECLKLKYVIMPETIKEFGLWEIFRIKGSAETVLYSCATVPAEQTGVYTLAYGRDTSLPYLEDGLYCDLYVPYGCISAYKQKGSTWNYSPVKQLTPIVICSDLSSEVNEDNATFTTTVKTDGIVEDDIPQIFLDANDFTSAADKAAGQLDFQYREAGSDICLDGVVTVAENRQCVVELTALPLGNYEYRWTNEKRAADDDPAVTTDWQPFVISTATGIESVEADDNEAEYYNLQGVRVCNPRGGVYLKRRGSKVTKMTIKPE